jgi:hypothetical protein
MRIMTRVRQAGGNEELALAAELWADEAWKVVAS